MPKPRVLIVGASIAGPATAFWLVRAGYDITIVELAPQVRSGGNGVDIREQALAVTEPMGLLPRIRERAMDSAGMRFVDRHDRVVARIDMEAMHRAIGSEDIEIARGDLAHLLHDATHNDVEYLFGDSILALDQDAAGVEVRFEHQPPRRFDLVIGADGLHSRVRRLAFGPEADFLAFKQHYFAVASADLPFGEARWATFYNTPGKAAAILRPAAGPALLNLMFRSEQPIAYDHRDIAQQRRLVRDALAGMGWRVPELLAATDAAPDFYFDSLSQVQMPSWSAGRVLLVGDAAACASPASGAGALLALIGAYRLGGELAAGGDPVAALRRYEVAHRPLVAQKQATLFTGISVPKTRLGIIARNLVAGSPLLGLLAGRPSTVEPLRDYDFSAAALA